MSDNVPDDALVELVESGMDQIRRDPELTEQARERLTLSMANLAERIAFELDRENP